MNGKRYLWQPLSPIPIDCDPYLKPVGINLCDFGLQEICKCFRFDDGNRLIYNKILVNDSDPSLIVVVVLGGLGGLMQCCNLSGDPTKVVSTSWTTVDTQDYLIDDAIVFKNQFYAMDVRGNLLLFDSDLSGFSIVIDEYECPSFLRGGKENKLVVFKSELYVVSRVDDLGSLEDYMEVETEEDEEHNNAEIPLILKVFKLGKEDSWEHMANLDEDDDVLLSSDDVSTGVSIKGLNGCKGNCVCFTHSCFVDGDDVVVYGNDLGVYDLETSKAMSIDRAITRRAMFWLPPQFMFP